MLDLLCVPILLSLFLGSMVCVAGGGGSAITVAAVSLVAGIPAWAIARVLASPKRIPPHPINIVAGLVLPMPDDPRWHAKGKLGTLECGPVKVIRTYNFPRTDGEVYVDDGPLDRGGAYARAVLAAWDARNADERRARQARALDEFMGVGS